MLRERHSGRRKVLAVAALLLFALVVRLIWGVWSERRAREAVAALRARGEAVEAAEVVYPDVPDAENAWELQAKAMRGLSMTSPRHTNMEYPNYPPYSSKWMELADASERASAKAFALVRDARRLSAVKFRTTLKSPIQGMLLTHLNGVRALANTLADGIAYAHVTGHDGEAIERSLDLLHVARSIRHEDFVISQLVAIGIEATACHEIQSIAPGLRLDAKSATRPATTAQVRRLIDVLLNEDLARRGLERSIVTERISWIETSRMRADGTWVIRPLAHHAIARGLSNFDIISEALRAETMPAAQRIFDRCEWGWPDATRLSAPAVDNVPRYSRWFDGYDLTSTAYIERHFRIIAERRATAASLACQLFRAERGRWPERLEELVPTHLPRVPVDPFFEDGRWIGYLVLHGALPDGGDRPLLYWYVADFDYGPPPGPTYGWYLDERCPPGRWRQHRQYRDVSRFVPPPPPPPSTQAVPNDPQEPDAPGQQQQPDDERQ